MYGIFAAADRAVTAWYGDDLERPEVVYAANSDAERWMRVVTEVTAPLADRIAELKAEAAAAVAALDSLHAIVRHLEGTIERGDRWPLNIEPPERITALEDVGADGSPSWLRRTDEGLWVWRFSLNGPMDPMDPGAGAPWSKATEAFEGWARVADLAPSRTPREWPVNSPEPLDVDTFQYSHGVRFQGVGPRAPMRSYLALEETGGDGELHSWTSINHGPLGSVVFEVVPEGE